MLSRPNSIEKFILETQNIKRNNCKYRTLPALESGKIFVSGTDTGSGLGGAGIIAAGVLLADFSAFAGAAD